MNIRCKLQAAVAVLSLIAFGITGTGLDLAPQDEFPALGIVATALDFLPEDEAPVLGVTFNFVD